MLADEHNRPAAAGRVVWALLASLLAHALLITASGGRGNSEWSASASAFMPRPVLSATLAGDTPEAIAVTAQTTDGREDNSANDSRYGNSTNQQSAGQIGSTLGLAAPTHYHPARELDVRPQIRSQVEPAYPRIAFEQGETGSARLRIFIDAQGRVDRVLPLDRDAGNPFVAAAIKAFSAALYIPGQKNGVPVPSVMAVEVQFESFTAPDTLRRSNY